MAGQPKAYNLKRGRVDGTLSSDDSSDQDWSPNKDARERMAEKGVRIAAATEAAKAKAAKRTAASGDTGATAAGSETAQHLAAAERRIDNALRSAVTGEW